MKLLPGVDEVMLHADFWVEYIQNHPNSRDDQGSRRQCNQTILNTSRAMTNMLQLASDLEASNSPADLARSYLVVATRDNRALYDQHGDLIDDAFWSAVATQSAVELTEETIRPGVAVRRADVRTWPSETKAFSTAYDQEFDQFQETALHTFEPVIVFTRSMGGDWLLIQSQTYQGWVQASDIAFCDWDRFRVNARLTHMSAVDGTADDGSKNDVSAVRSPGFIVATGPYVSTQAQPYEAATSKQPVEFAAYIPVDTTPGEALGNQTDVGHFRVNWPVRADSGALRILPAYVSRYLHVAEGFLQFSRENVVRSAFSMLTERYGWGDSFGCHDCSSFVMDVYRTVGVQLPRNAGAQEDSYPSKVVFPPAATLAERYQLLSQLHTGDPLYMPGHTMIYLGKVGGRHYVIHDFVGYAEEVDGVRHDLPVNEIMVSTLDILTRSGNTFLEGLTTGLQLLK